MKDFGIGEVAARTGLATSAIRYYERMCIVPKPYRLNGRRLYDDKWMNALGFTMLVLDAGFSIREIQKITQAQKTDAPSAFLNRLADQKMNQLDEQIKQIEQTKTLLKMVSSCGCNSIEQCGELALNKTICAVT
ncbi:MAG: MerR family transcriptional regulator [OCS116 cluster bacterium]|uniref:HTH merR-type domain-containing protein n=1 Tax=OCS116 cluster bacterium TaxID=2030921 RepID=A0A2A4Z9X0_9PROT|nr:MerR family transcriptional regulator [OCS116 cluster bacterium]